MINKTLLCTAIVGAFFMTIALNFCSYLISLMVACWLGKKMAFVSVRTFHYQMGFAFCSAGIVICNCLFCGFIHNVNSTIYYCLNYRNYRCFCG